MYATIPVPKIEPVQPKERIYSMDVLRGVALLGILIPNVTALGIPGWNYHVPLAMTKPAFEGAHAHLNLTIWLFRWLVAEGKMRGLFSMLFGAGVVLFTNRAERHGTDAGVADLFLRRNLWLLAFGVVHAYFIWFGDILYFYGLTALIFLFPCRNLKTRTALLAGSCVLAAGMFLGPLSGGVPIQDGLLHRRVMTAEKLQKAGQPLTGEQKSDLQAWSKRLAEWKPDRQMIEADLAAKRAGYLSSQRSDVPWVREFEKSIFYDFGFCDVLGMMLLGIGLVKNGFLTAKLSNKTYAKVAFTAGVISLSVVSLATWKAWSSSFGMLTSERWLFFTMDPGRVSGAIAIAAIVMLAVKANTFPRLLRRVAAVGQTAFSNYLLTNIICKFIFVWGPWKLYNNVEYYQLYYVLLGVWIFNLAWSATWLKYFRYGPFEWLWRSLTYWEIQPMRIQRGSLQSSFA
jgi:uncharacterized protein